MSKPMKSFTGEILNIDDIVVYLNNECKFIGQIVDFIDIKVKIGQTDFFIDTKVIIRRLSPPDTFVTPEEIQNYGEVIVSPDDIISIIISKYDENIIKNIDPTLCISIK